MTIEVNKNANAQDIKAAFGLDVGETPSPTNHLDMPKPYIDLGNNFSGIMGLFMYDHQAAKVLTDLGQVIMRRTDRSLSVWERELIGAYVSKLNDCEFCFQSHMAAAKTLGEAEKVEAFLLHEDSSVLTERQQALMSIVVETNHLQFWDTSNIPYTIELAKKLDATDQDIHDTVLVASFFAMCNRYVEALGTTFAPGEP
jgi:uncharacterized peroxidase-related enzyme